MQLLLLICISLVSLQMVHYKFSTVHGSKFLPSQFNPEGNEYHLVDDEQVVIADAKNVFKDFGVRNIAKDICYQINERTDYMAFPENFLRIKLVNKVYNYVYPFHQHPMRNPDFSQVNLLIYRIENQNIKFISLGETGFLIFRYDPDDSVFYLVGSSLNMINNQIKTENYYSQYEMDPEYDIRRDGKQNFEDIPIQHMDILISGSQGLFKSLTKHQFLRIVNMKKESLQDIYDTIIQFIEQEIQKSNQNPEFSYNLDKNTQFKYHAFSDNNGKFCILELRNKLINKKQKLKKEDITLVVSQVKKHMGEPQDILDKGNSQLQTGQEYNQNDNQLQRMDSVGSRLSDSDSLQSISPSRISVTEQAPNRGSVVSRLSETDSVVSRFSDSDDQSQNNQNQNQYQENFWDRSGNLKASQINEFQSSQIQKLPDSDPFKIILPTKRKNSSFLKRIFECFGCDDDNPQNRQIHFNQIFGQKNNLRKKKQLRKKRKKARKY